MSLMIVLRSHSLQYGILNLMIAIFISFLLRVLQYAWIIFTSQAQQLDKVAVLLITISPEW